MAAFREWRRRMFARSYDRVTARHESFLSERKRALLADVRGTVLEIGPGTGANLSYLDPAVRWIGVEPNEHMRELLSDRARTLGLEVDFRDVTPHGLDAADESVDVVLSTLVLCSVPDPVPLIRDIRRVLRPGGRFVFVEHVAGPPGTLLRFVQRGVRPVWRFLADGCCPDRELATIIRSAGFESVRLEEFRVPKRISLGVVAPHIAGQATKGSEP